MAYGTCNIEKEEYELLEIEALVVRESYGLYDNYIDIFDFVVSKLGATLVPFSTLNKEKLESAYNISKKGFIALTDVGTGYCEATIFYNDSMPEGNQRYTLAHEAYHIIHQHTNPTDKEESYAEYFAKVFLAPKLMVLQLGDFSAENIKKEFGLSIEASQYMNYGIENRYRTYKDFLFPHEVEFLKNKPQK